MKTYPGMKNQPYPKAQEQWQDEQGCQELIALWGDLAEKAMEEALVGRLVAELPAHKTVVDLGCGSGRVIPCLPEFARYRGFDTSPHLLAAAQTTYAADRRCTFTAQDLFAGAPYKRPVDVLLSIGVTRHYTDPYAVARQIMATWPAKFYVFDFLHYAGPAVDLLNARCLASDALAAELASLGLVVARDDQPLIDGMLVTYVVIRPDYQSVMV